MRDNGIQMTAHRNTVHGCKHNDIVARYCRRLPDFVRYRLDPRLAGRISPAEVAEELATILQGKANSHRCPRRESLFRCLRSSATTLLEQVHSDYLAMYRAFGDPYLLRLSSLPPAKASELAEMLLGIAPTRPGVFDDGSFQPADSIVLQCVFNSLSFRDREILAMRHFERLSRSEIAVILEIDYVETCARYVAALGRLKREYHGLNCLRTIPLVSYTDAQ